MLRFFIVIVLILFNLQSVASSDCNFKTGKFINKLQKPNNIDLIEIKIAKSAKFASNFFKILTSKNDVIPAKLKKRFNGTVIVHYKFGKCEYTAKIRQSGDRKDHVKFVDNGKALRSLDIKLNEGNIVRATRFKLLIPETRNGINEVLASLILKASGFISPETFEVPSLVNGTNSIMIFQEVENKELLERNHFRESAIFKGDESLLWSFKDYEKFALEPLALSIMVNDNWFMKGNSSQKISLYAYSQLQSKYLSYTASLENQSQDTWGVILDPNQNGSNIFDKFHFSLLAMNGTHGLRPHNRKYYFNPIISEFVPIYYDGDVDFVDLKKQHLGNEIIVLASKMFKKPLDERWIKQIKKIGNSFKLKNDFLDRVRIPKEDATFFFNNSINNYISNIKKLEHIIETSSLTSSAIEKGNLDKLNSYIQFQKANNVSQELISDINIKNNEYFVTYISGKTEILSVENVKNVISKNSLNDERVTLLGSKNIILKIDTFERKIPSFPGRILATPGIIVDIENNNNNKVISFTQSNYDDWALILSAELNGWDINFKGKKNMNPSLKEEQRFNQYGLTGCLTIYKSTFVNNKIQLNGGMCEDSLNIINSVGEIDSIFVKSAFSDALDIDFSKISASKVEIMSAGNDCLDVSDGKYKFQIIKLNDCNDKGLSIGEQSTFDSKFVKIDIADIGVSSKDLSLVHLDSVEFNKVNTCIELKQKKQEFGGSFLSVQNILCEGDKKIDDHSIFKLGES